MAEPVFYDPRRARWKRLRRLVDVLVAALSALIHFLRVHDVAGRALAGTCCSLRRSGPFKALKENEKDKARERQKKLASRSHRKSKLPASEVKLNQEEGIRAAFYVPWDAASFSSLRDFSRQIDILYPDWLHVLTARRPPAGRGRPDQQVLRRGAEQSRCAPVDDRVMPFLKAEDTSHGSLPHGEQFRRRELGGRHHGFLNDPDARALFRKQVAMFLASDRFRGLMVDFEAFPDSGQPGYVALLNELSVDLHARGMKLYVSVPPHNNEFNYAAIAAAADGVVLMNYDEHYPGAASGPVASQDWFVENLKFASKVIPKEKIICAIANYGYDWVQKPKKGKLPPDEHDTTVSVQEAWLAARDSEVDVDFDDDALNPHFSYLDEHSVRHDIWFLDGVTALNQMRAAQTLGIQTFALWRLGGEDRSLWRVWDVPGDADAADKLRDVPPGQDVDMEGQGEILRIEDRPTHGTRDLTIDPNSEADHRREFSRPCLSLIAWAATATARIKWRSLSTTAPIRNGLRRFSMCLSAKHAPATFFLIGIQADKFPGIAKRIYRRRPYHRQPHLHPSRRQQYFLGLHEGGVESYGAALRQPDGNSRHAAAPALCDR